MPDNKFKLSLDDEDEAKPVQKPVVPVVNNTPVSPVKPIAPVVPSETTKPVSPSNDIKPVKKKQVSTLQGEKIIKVSSNNFKDFPAKYYRPY